MVAMASIYEVHKAKTALDMRAPLAPFFSLHGLEEILEQEVSN